MNKCLKAIALCTLTVLLMSVSISAQQLKAGAKPPACHVKDVAGVYVAERPTATYFGTLGQLDQLVLGTDGVAYRYSSFAFIRPITEGMYLPEVGSWTCLKDGSVLITTVTTNFSPIIVPTPNILGANTLDLERDSNSRRTQKFSVIDDDTLDLNTSVIKRFLLTVDPSDPAAPTLGGFSVIPVAPGTVVYKRVKPLETDVP